MMSFTKFIISYNILNYLMSSQVFGSPWTSTPATITRYTETMTKNEYFRQREEFLKSEFQRYLGSDLDLNENELKLNKILMKLKNDEFEKGFKNPFEFKASRHFFEVVDSINESKLFELIEKMPKGAVLHAHDTAMASIDFVINDVINNPKYKDILWYCDNNGIQAADVDYLDDYDDALIRPVKVVKQQVQIRFQFSKTKPTKLANFNDWKLLDDVRRNYIPSKFNEMLYKQLTLYTEQPNIDYKDINDVWNKFANIFVTLNGIVLYEPVWAEYFRRSLEEFLKDGVQYIEYRGLLPTLYDLDNNSFTQLDTLYIYNATLEQFKAENPDFIGAKFIFGPNRRVDNVTFTDYMKSVIQFKAQYPNFIAGFDLVAQEDLGNPLKDYIESLLNLHESHPDIDFYFHAGETNWNGMDTDENLIDAILLGAKRIGHGYAILKHPKVMEEIKRRNIAIEINPISNQVLKLVNDNRNHPCAHLFADNYPVVVSSDDPSFWKAKPLSHDFYIALMGMASAHSDLRLLKKLAMNSLDYSSLKGNDYYRAKQLWEQKWNEYVDNILKEYPA